MDNCIFCKIAAKEIPSECVYEDNLIYAFKDIEPQAPMHIVIIPKIHIKSANEITPDNAKYVSHIFECVPIITKNLGIAADGYRIVNNCGKLGGQTVDHLHFHLMGGREFGWPAG